MTTADVVTRTGAPSVGALLDLGAEQHGDSPAVRFKSDGEWKERSHAELRETARDLAQGLHLSTIVIEHDINFIRDLAAPVTVLHLGRVLTEGPFEAVAKDPRVRDVYLGTG